MDDIQTILYIVIGIIYLLAQALRKKKRPPVPPPTDSEEYVDEGTPTTEPVPERKKPLSFEELIREISGEMTGEKKTTEPEPEPQPETARPLVSDSQARSTYQESIEKAQKLKKKKQQAIEGPKSQFFEDYEIEEKRNYFAEEIAESLKNTQDIRKAIVLNEILTRKYD